LTHAHVDHVGGLTLNGTPLFPQAEVFVNAAEVAFWRNDTIFASVPDEAKPFFVAARTAFDAYDKNLHLVTGGEVAPGITLVPLPGHTPGHSGYQIASGADNLLIWADITHLADVQIRRPEVTIAFDTDADEARATRRKLLDQVATDKLVVAGTHFNMPGFITVEREGAGYTKVDLPWTPALL
jgi:glyoxylase-like metal-dependent hydrolase (beta-lactamase superfamily II)